MENILDVKLQSNEIFYYVKWVGYHINESTWEPSSHLHNAPKKIQDYFRLFPKKEII